MSKVSVEDLDVYGILKLSDDCTTQDIKKAYRKAALECHPDKNPDDAKAAEKFIQLGAILKLLLEPHSRKAYDALRKARLQNKIRLEKQDSVRKKLREDLERRERESATSKADTRTAEQKLKAEIERLRKESSRQLEEEIAAMERLVQQELEREREGKPTDDGQTHRLKLKWRRNGPNYTTESLTDIFSKYGEISALVISKKGGSALLEYEDFFAADDAVEMEKGLADNPIDVSWVSTKPSSKSQPSQPAEYSEPPPEDSGIDFEELVLSRLHEAQQLQDSKAAN